MERAPCSPQPTTLWRDPSFRFLFLGQGVSYLGDAFAAVAFPLIVVLLTGSGLMMGVVGALESAPMFVLGIPAGVLADRWDRRRVLIVTDFGRVILFALVPVNISLHVGSMTTLVATATGAGILGVFYGSAFTGVIQQLWNDRHLSRVNGYL